MRRRKFERVGFLKDFLVERRLWRRECCERLRRRD
jgi:hypothetical protein